jgi:hypothetical protein
MQQTRLTTRFKLAERDRERRLDNKRTKEQELFAGVNANRGGRSRDSKHCPKGWPSGKAVNSLRNGLYCACLGCLGAGIRSSCSSE